MCVSAVVGDFAHSPPGGVLRNICTVVYPTLNLKSPYSQSF